MSAKKGNSGTSGDKHRMQWEISRISNYLSLKYTHNTILALAIFSAAYLALLLQSMQGLYSLAAIFFSPYFIYYVLKERYESKIMERFLLDNLARHYKYHQNIHSMLSISFFLEFIILGLWQLSNFMFPYEVLVPQYLPGALLVLMCLLRILLYIFFRFRLHHQMMNNNF